MTVRLVNHFPDRSAAGPPSGPGRERPRLF
jgi:hypothetical protein